MVPVTWWVLPFGSEQSEANKCALAAALQSAAFHVRQKTQPLYHQSLLKHGTLCQLSLPCSRRCGSTQKSWEAQWAAWHPRGAETSASTHMLPCLFGARL